MMHIRWSKERQEYYVESHDNEALSVANGTTVNVIGKNDTIIQCRWRSDAVDKCALYAEVPTENGATASLKLSMCHGMLVQSVGGKHSER